MVKASWHIFKRIAIDKIISMAHSPVHTKLVSPL